jgi:P4 family phage/plasmid primase-like protien
MGGSLSSWYRTCVTYSDEYTHISMVDPRCRLLVSRDSIEDAWNDYCSSIIDNPNIVLGVGERPQQFSQVMFDFDLVKQGALLINLYTQNQIQDTVSIIQDILEDIIEKEDNDEDKFLCFVLEKKPYFEGNNIKNGFHLQFPNLFLSQKDIDVYIISKVQNVLAEREVFGPKKKKDDDGANDKRTDYKKVVDSIYKKTWLLYGSRKTDKKDTYKLTSVYKKNCIQISINEGIQLCSIYDAGEIEIKKDPQILEFYLPRILSIFPFGRRISNVKPNLDIRYALSRIPIYRDFSNIDVRKHETTQSYNEYMADIKTLVDLLSPNRSVKFNEWIEVGWIIYCVTNGSQDGLVFWIDFSKKCPEKFDESSCIFHWSKMEKRNFTIGTLKYYANKDNPEGYKKFKDRLSYERVTYCLNGTNFRIALLLHTEYANEFVCTNFKNNVWYRFQDHRWKKCEDGFKLRLEISRLPVTLFKNLKKTLEKKLKEAARDEDEDEDSSIDEDSIDYVQIQRNRISNIQQRRNQNSSAVDDPEKLKSDIKQVNKLISKLETTSFISGTMKICKDLFYDEDFTDKINKNRFIYGVKNGVLDLQECIFREGRPSDYITSNANFEYTEYSEEHPVYQDLMDFLGKVFPDPEIKEYFLFRKCLVMYGGNYQKVIEIWSGGRDNGKTTTITLFELMLGSLCIKLPTSFATGSRPSSSSATPELSRLSNGVRQIFLDEPDMKRSFNTAVLKQFSGNGSIFSRFLFDNGGDIQNFADISIECNDLPRLSYIDDAISRRLRVIPFESTFAEEAPSDVEEQRRKNIYPIDRNMENKINEMAPCLGWLLFQKWKYYKNKINDIKQPAKVMRATEYYLKQNDLYYQFIGDNMVEDEKSKVKVMEVYVIFKEWHRECNPNAVIPTKNEFIQYMARKIGPVGSDKLHWYGYKLLSESKGEDDESNPLTRG